MFDLSCDAPRADLPAPLWRLILEARGLSRTRGLGTTAMALKLDADHKPAHVHAGDSTAPLKRDAQGLWRVASETLDAHARAALQLYLPFCNAHAALPLTIAHLGQSLDGRIATRDGASHYVNDAANIVHLHRMRALSDAVIVGAETVRLDNPRLTTRHVAGPNPTRIVLDPSRRLDAHHTVFSDGQVRTWLVCANDCARPDRSLPAAVHVVAIPRQQEGLDLGALTAKLYASGLYAVLVEGGGRTVSAFLEQGLLNRLQITIAPLIIGSGRHGISLPPIHSLSEGLRPRHEILKMGNDVLFDCELENSD